MDPYGRVIYNYRDNFLPPPRRDPRSYDSFQQRSYDPPPAPVEYPRTVQRVYAAPPPPSNSQVEIRYYDPALGPPYQPAPAPTVAPAPPPMQIKLPTGPGSQFEPGQLYKVVGVEETQLYHAAPPQPRAVEYGYPSLPRGPPSGRHYYPYH